MAAGQGGGARRPRLDRFAANHDVALMDLQVLQLDGRFALIALEAQQRDRLAVVPIPVDLNAVALDHFREVVQQRLGADGQSFSFYRRPSRNRRWNHVTVHLAEDPPLHPAARPANGHTSDLLPAPG